MTKIKGHLSKNTNRQATRINTRQFQSSNAEQVDRTNIKRVKPLQVQNKIQDNQNKAAAHQILARRYPQAAGMDYEGLVNLDKSTTPVSFNGKVYVGKNYQSASYSQDNKSDQEHKQAQDAFIQNQEQQRKEDEIKQTIELLNNPYNPIGWIPGVRSVVNTGADQNYFRTHNTAFTPYTADAAYSTAGDAITLGFGLGPLKNYAGSYAGTVAGGLIGEQFDNPQLGQIIGGITGGFSPQIYNSTIKGIQSGQRAYNIFRLSRELNKAANSFDGTVGTNYFKSPSNWYRVTESPEIMDIKYQGKNVTTRDIYSYDSPSNDFRNFVIKNQLKPGIGENEGYWVMPRKKSMISLTKSGAAHGNTSQAAKGEIWGGTFAKSYKFPTYIIEGEGPTEVFRGFNPATGTDSRTNFVKVPWEEVPFGARVGFHTGEMPMEGLRAFRRLPNDRYQYEGSILPDRVIRIDNLSLSQPNPQNTPKTNYSLYERPSKLTSAERAGIPKGERNNISSPVNPDEEFKLMYGYSRPSAGSHQQVSTLLPNELPKFSEVTNPKYSFKYYASPDGSMNLLDPGSQYITNLKEYIATLPKSEMINQSIITDYRNYLSRIGENPYILTDQQISDLITSQYNTLSSEMSGKLKGVPLFHGSAVPVEQFNFQANTGKGIFNMGAAGPGNYFSTGRHNYHIPFIYDEATGGFKQLGDMQPYLINNVQSTPISHTLQRKGILPNYQEPPIGWVKTLRSQQRLQRNGADLSEEEIKQLENSIKEYQNSAEYQEYIKQNIEPYLKDRDMFIIDNDAIGQDLPLGRTFMPSLNGTKIQSIEGVIPRNSGIKSLFPHPSTLIKDSDGNWIIKRNWLDTRVNYKNGGKIKYEAKEEK